MFELYIFATNLTTTLMKYTCKVFYCLFLASMLAGCSRKNTEQTEQEGVNTVLPELTNEVTVMPLRYTTFDHELVSNGKVTAVKAGTATITVRTEDGNKSASCAVTVAPKTYPVESVTLNKTAIELTEGEKITLTATVNPSNATNKNVSWSSSDAGVATVANGEVTAVKAGTATITVKTEDGNKTATGTVTVKKKKIDTEKDNGGLNFGKGGGAGDNIDEEEDIFDGGSF